MTTASRVVNEGARKVGPEMAERVNRAVTELGYQANLQARAVASGYTSMIGVMVRDIDDPYFSSITAGLIEATDAHQLLVCMSSTSSGEQGEREYVALMRAQWARAVVLIGSRSHNTAAREALGAEVSAFTASGGRVSCIGQDLLGVDTIMPENAAGAEALAHALAALGHRSFAILAGPRELITAHDRVAGFRAGLRSWSVDVDPRWLIEGAFTRDGGYEAMSAVLAAGGERPDCVFAVNDVMAVGALARLRAAGHFGAIRHRPGGLRRHPHPPGRVPAADHGPAAAQAHGRDGRQPGPGRRQPGPAADHPGPGEVILRQSTLPRGPGGRDDHTAACLHPHDRIPARLDPGRRGCAARP